MVNYNEIILDGSKNFFDVCKVLLCTEYLNISSMNEEGISKNKKDLYSYTEDVIEQIENYVTISQEDVRELINKWFYELYHLFKEYETRFDEDENISITFTDKFIRLGLHIGLRELTYKLNDTLEDMYNNGTSSIKVDDEAIEMNKETYKFLVDIIEKLEIITE